jgi:hypothetical protein
MLTPVAWLAFGLAASSKLAAAQQAGSIVQVGNTQISAMMVRIRLPCSVLC